MVIHVQVQCFITQLLLACDIFLLVHDSPECRGKPEVDNGTHIDSLVYFY